MRARSLRLSVALTLVWACGDKDSSSDDLAALEARLASLEQASAATAAALAANEERTADLEAHISTWEPVVAANTTRLDELSDAVLDLEGELGLLHDEYSAVDFAELTDLLGYVEVDTTEPAVVISGANLYIQSGSGSTDGPVNGLGNLIIGYAEDSEGVDRSGSHNLVVGIDNSWQSYGGVVAGWRNTISGPYSSVTGGMENVASGTWSSVTGGRQNEALGDYSSASGGEGNAAYGQYASVSGGMMNEATGDSSSISGGYGNVASGSYSSITGGADNTAEGGYSSVTGGKLNEAAGEYSSIYGGGSNRVSESLGYGP